MSRAAPCPSFTITTHAMYLCGLVLTPKEPRIVGLVWNCKFVVFARYPTPWARRGGVHGGYPGYTSVVIRSPRIENSLPVHDLLTMNVHSRRRLLSSARLAGAHVMSEWHGSEPSRLATASVYRTPFFIHPCLPVVFLTPTHPLTPLNTTEKQAENHARGNASTPILIR